MQANGGLAGARGALDADRLAGVGAHDVVLLGLNGRHDVAHRAGPWPLDLLDQQADRLGRGRPGPAGGLPGAVRIQAVHARAARIRAARIRAGRELLVFEGGQVAAGEPEPAAQREPHRMGPAGAVERPGDRGAPVDDDRVAGRVMHVPPSDVERSAV
jgi:hypothetical protein